ncbi:MAG: LOG family protein [Planctomycetes bacterium]|nr:LOG family protein [Planctomycetota bacterium]MBI3836255.1 LOG family protein [Planctomycetota bacterium]
MEKPIQSTAGIERRQARQDAIRRFLSEFGNSDNKDLLEEMMITISRLAADQTDRGDMKIINTAMRELRYAFKIFAPYAHVPKVTMFGSARTPEDHPQYKEAKKFAELIGQKGWMVITGAGDGIMRAGHHGATRESSFGVSISLPFEQSTNTIIMGDAKLVNFKYFFTRKLMFVKEAEAIVLFPGGFGTQDECFEALTLVQTAKTPIIPVVMCDEPGGTYWQHWRTYVKAELLNNRMIDPPDMELFHVTDRAEDAVNEIMKFYRRYHSMRYVWDRLVIRMNSALPDAVVTELNREFAGILSGGAIEQRNDPFDEEEGAFPEKPRLVLQFDRRSNGRLRMLINRINDEPV